jgi:chromosome segregation ATPase
MLEKELAAARKLISTNNDEVELLKKQNNELTGQTMHLKEQTTKLESTASRCEQLSVQAEEHQNQLKELLSQLNDVKQTNTEQTDAVQKQLTEAYQNIQQLTADVDYNSDNEIKVNDITIDSLSLAQLANLLVEQIQQAQQHIQTSLVIPLKEKTTELDNKQCELKELKEQSALLASSPSSSNETEMAALASKVEALSQELDEIKGEKATLETAMTKLEQEKTDETAVLKATIADLEKRTDGQDGSASTGGGKAAKKARRELNEVKRKLEASEKTLASIKTEHETALDGTKNRIEELEAQVNVAIKERDEARSRVDQLMEEKESVAKKAIEIADIVTLNNKTIEELSQTLARFEETLEKKEKELDDANNQLASLKQISHDLTDKLKVSDQELTEQRETNNKVVKEREKLQEAATQALISLEDTKKEVTIAQTRIEELSTELETSVSLGRERDIEMAKLKGSAKEHEDNVIKLTEMLKACRQQIEKLRQERDGHVKTIEERSANAARLEELVERAAQQSKADVAERDKLKAAVEDLTNTCDKLEEKKTQLVDSLQMKQAECESLESALKQLQSRLDAAEQQQQRQIDRVKILEEELSTSRRLFSQKSSECDEVKTKMAELESVYRTTETRLERELKRREERAVSLAKEMDGIRSEKDSIQQTMKQQLQKIIKERDEITVQLSNVKEELSRVQAEQIATLDKLTTVTNDMAIAKQQEESISLQLSQERARIASIEKEKTQLDGQLEESTLRESHLRTLNKVSVN